MKIKNVCIVGGGTTGWMMAVALNVNVPNLKVTLVESEEIPSIGVGEATIPLTAKFISSVLKFDEKEWLAASDATYKTAIRFNNFSNSVSPNNYLPTFLNNKYPYAQEGDLLSLVYRYFDGGVQLKGDT